MRVMGWPLQEMTQRQQFQKLKALFADSALPCLLGCGLGKSSDAPHPSAPSSFRF